MRSQFLQSPQLGGIGRRGKASIAPLAAYAAGGYVPPLVLDHVGDVYGVGGAVSSFGDTVTFARTSAASYFNASGVMQTAASGEARTAHHLYVDSAWSLGGLLLEPQAENLFPYSQDLSQWSTYQTATLAQDEAGLDGALSAVTVADDSGGGASFVSVLQTVTVETTTEYVFSIAGKPDGLTGAMLYPNAFTAVAGKGRYFDLDAGTIGTTYSTGGGAGLTPLIQDFGDFHMPSLSFVSHSSDTSGQPSIYLADLSGTPTIAVDRDGTSSIILSDAQFEKGKIPTSRIITTGSTGTRAADTLTIAAADVPGDFFLMTGFLNYADEGLAELQVLFKRETDANNLMKLTLDTSGANNGTFTLTVVTAGTTVALSTTADISPGFNVAFRLAFGATGSELALAMGGSAETRVASGLPDLSAVDVEIGLHGTLSRLLGWSEDIGDSGLEEASSAGFFSVAAGAYDAQVNHVPVYGQSLSLGSMPVLTTAEAYDHLMFYRGLRAQVDYPGETPAQWYASLVPAVEAVAETPSRGMADMVKERIADEEGWLFTDHKYRVLLSNPGESATSIAQLSYGTDNFSRLIDQITFGKALATAAGDSYLTQAVSYVHGTTDYVLGTTYAAYLASLVTLIADIQTYGKAASGQTKRIPIIATQVATHNVSASDAVPDIALAQLSCCENNPDYYLATPLYHLPYKDQYHPTNIGERWLGAYLGIAYKRIVVDGEDWSPVRPTSWVQIGADLDVTFHVRGSGVLEWDTTQVAAQTNYGFELVDGGGSPLTINSVSITGTNTVRVTAAAAIPAGAKLRYAWQGDVNKGLGNLRDNQGDTIVFDPAGASHPMHNWCVIFEVVL